MEEEFSDKKKKKFNTWTGIAAALAVLLVFNVVTGAFVLSGGISKDQAAEKAIDFINTNLVQDGGVELESVKEVNDMYELTTSYQGQDILIYVTKDGKKVFTSQPFDMTETLSTPEQPQEQQPQDVTKSDKPKVELFIMTHCPYGTQAEKAIIPVFELLGEKIEGSIKFVHYFMHDPEKTETPRQVCIREEQPEKFIPYLGCFLEGDGVADANGYIANSNDPVLCMERVGIDINEVDKCIDTNADGYYQSDSELSNGYGVRGSPTLIINENQISVSRSPEAIKQAICNAFNTVPEECSKTLSIEQASPGFGFNIGTGSAGECS